MEIPTKRSTGAAIDLRPLGEHGVTGKGMLPLTVERVVTLMNVLAFHMSRSLCDPADCEDCNRLNTLYWWLSEGLTIRERTQQQNYLLAAGVALPASPIEWVGTGDPHVEPS
jgi:hypothetical protein